jgi:hypothetical protein
MRMFLFVDGEEITAWSVEAIPRVGDAVWVKTAGYEGTSIVESVEHQFDLVKQETYGTQDVCLYTKSKPST